MSSTTASISVPHSRALNIALVIGRILFGVVFLAAAFFKLSGQPMMVAEFGEIGFGQWFRILTGVIEVTGALLLIRPMTVSYGAGLLTAVSIGAIVAQAAVLHQDVIHAIVFAVLLGAIAYAYLPERRKLA